MTPPYQPISDNPEDPSGHLCIMLDNGERYRPLVTIIRELEARVAALEALAGVGGKS